MAKKKPPETSARQMEARILHLSETLDRLVAKAEANGVEMQGEYIDGIESLRESLESARERIETLRTDGNSDWHEVMSRVESAWEELEDAFRRIAES